MGASLDWTSAATLASAGIDPSWLQGVTSPHRTFMHPDFVLQESKWAFIADYITISMVSDKASGVLFPNLKKKARPRSASADELLREASHLNRYLRLVMEAGLSGERIAKYHGDLRTHGQGQNDSGQIGAIGAAVAIRDALEEISPGAIIGTHGWIPSGGISSPSDIVREMRRPTFMAPKALLLSTQRAIVFSSDPDIAIISRIGGSRYQTAEEAVADWSKQRRWSAEERNSTLHQAALGEVKTALDPSNIHERLALGSRENRDEAGATRFLLMAVLTPDILDPQRVGRRAMFSPDAQRFHDVFNLYFVWGYDSSREIHHEHWNDFKRALRRWVAL